MKTADADADVGAGTDPGTGGGVRSSRSGGPPQSALQTVRIWPSLLAADLADLAGAARSVSGAAGLHVDMMDGCFVPNLTLGPPVLAALRRHTDLPLEAHLMVEHPEDWLEDLAEAGASRIMVHTESGVHLQRTLARARELGMQTAAALNPATPIDVLRYVWPDLDAVLVMTVNPGFGGQRMLPQTLEKVADVRRWLTDLGRPDIRIAVDGGMDLKTAPEAVRQGALDVVAGTAIFGSPDPEGAVRTLQVACQAAVPSWT